MNKSYVKLYRSILENHLLASNNNAFLMFVKLLLKVDYKTGTITIGRKQLAHLCNMKPGTTYSTTKWLELNSFITTYSTTKYTKITLVNWEKYQSTQQPTQQLLNSKSTTVQQEINTIKRIKNKELRSIYISKDILVETQKVYDLFIEKFNRNPNSYKLTAARKAKIKTRLNDAGYDLIAQAITNISRQPFYQGDNDRGWKADLDFILRSYEQVERLATQQTRVRKGIDIL